MNLRCILQGSERNRDIKLGFNMQQSWNSIIKIPSKQFDLKKFSTYNSNLWSGGSEAPLAPWLPLPSGRPSEEGAPKGINPGVWSGLIDGEGNFSSRQQLVIAFHSLDVSLAYYIKKRLGYGSVKKVKNKNAIILVVAAREGIKKVINLINGKIRTENKFNQITNNILNHDNYVEFN